MTGARAVVDILLHSGNLRQDGDKLTSDVTTKVDAVSESQRKSPPSESVTNIVVKNEGMTAEKPSITLNIELSITAKASELSGLGKKIKSLLDDIRSTE